MHGRMIALAVAACGWLIASLAGFVLVVHFGFFAVGLIGLLIWFVCVRMDLEKDAAVGSGWAPAAQGMHSQAPSQSPIQGKRFEFMGCPPFPEDAAAGRRRGSAVPCPGGRAASR